MRNVISILVVVLFSNISFAKTFISNSCWNEASRIASEGLDHKFAQSTPDFKVTVIKPFEVKSTNVYETSPPRYEYVVQVAVEGENRTTSEWAQKQFSITVEISFSPDDLGSIGTPKPCDKAVGEVTKIKERD